MRSIMSTVLLKESKLKEKTYNTCIAFKNFGNICLRCTLNVSNFNEINSNAAFLKRKQDGMELMT